MKITPGSNAKINDNNDGDCLDDANNEDDGKRNKKKQDGNQCPHI